MLKILAVSLALTLVFEELFALAWGLRGRRELGLMVLVNHTAAGLWRWDPVLVTVALEAAAVLVEWRCWRALSDQVKRPFLFSLLCNGFSYGVGCMLNLL